MGLYLGIDTSNYTTSVALCDGNEVVQGKRFLPVKEGELGLRQSDAVFEHTRQLPDLIANIFSKLPQRTLTAVGVSARPRDVEGSYMPCFLAGVCAAKCIASACEVPVYELSHQAGHVAAAIFSSGKLDLITEKFICFHFSGGTTECLLVSPDLLHVFKIKQIATSLDLKAGQAIDRVGQMLGLKFPAGPALSRLAQQSHAEFHVTPAFKGNDVSLSGVENKCSAMIRYNMPAPDVARCCLEYICAAADRMTENALREYGDLPIVYAGGVMSSSYIRERLTSKYGGAFADPAFSSDNAAGIAVLTMIKDRQN